MKNKPITHVQLPSIEVIENLHFNIRVRDTRIKDLEKELKALKQINLTNSLGNGIFGHGFKDIEEFQNAYFKNMDKTI